VEKELSGAQITNLTVSNNTLNQLKGLIDASFEKFTVKFGAEITSLEIATGLTIKTPKELSQALNRQITQSRQLAESQDKIVALQNQIKNTASEAAKSYNLLGRSFDKTRGGASKFRATFTELVLAAKASGEVLTDTDDQYVVLFDRLRTLSKESILAAQAGDQIDLTKLKESITAINQIPQIPRNFEEVAGELLQQITALNEIVTLQQEINTTRAAGDVSGAAGGLETQLQNAAGAAGVLEEKYGGAADKAKEQADSQAKTAGQVSSTTTALGGMNQQLAFGVSATSQILTNLQQASQISFGNASQTAATGGLMHLAKGGGPRGTDNIPAWLSPGEFVVNARSTRRFYSQLQAMNAGTQPVYRQEGGPVTNIGDINVTMGGSQGQSSDATGRKIARSLRRELRRNTSQL
jgi:hypothetical protein